MASIEDLTRQNLDLTQANLRMYDDTERDLMAQINAMLASQDSMLEHEAALGISKAAEAYGPAAGGGELNKRYYLTQRRNPAAVIAAMQQGATIKGQMAGMRGQEAARQLRGALDIGQLALTKEQIDFQNQPASPWEIGASIFSAAAPLAFLSTKDAKKKVKGLPNKKLLADVKKMEIKEFEYKPGLGPMGKQIGMIIEDNPQEFDKGQKTVNGNDLYNFIGKLTGAVQALDEKIEKLAKA